MFKETAPVGVLALLILIGFGRLVEAPGSLIVDLDRSWIDERSRPRVRPIGNDLTGLFLPRHLWVGEQVRRLGRIPQWDPRGFGGRPNVGNPQAGLFYPPVWLVWLSGAPAALGWLTVAHLLIAGTGSYAIGRAIGLSRMASTVAGAVFMLNPYLMAQVAEGHLPHVWAASWFPWAFLGAIQLRRGHWYAGGLLPLSLAMAMLAGHPQEGVYLAVAMGLWAVFDLVRDVRARRWAALGRDGLRWGMAMALAVGLSAVEWLPDLLARPWTSGVGEAARSASLVGPYHLHPSDMLRLLTPRALGGPADYFGRGNFWETAMPIGGVPLVLLLAAIVGHADRRGVRAWVTLLALSVLHASGEAGGMAPLLARAVPVLGGLRVPARSLFLAAVAASVLAGMGVEAVSRGCDRGQAVRIGRWVAALGAIVMVGLVLGGVVGAASFTDLADRAVVDATARWCLACRRVLADPLFPGVMAGTMVAVTWKWRKPADSERVGRLLGMLAMAELAAWAVLILPVSRADRVLRPDTVSAALERVRPEGPFRVRASDRFYNDLHAFRDGIEKTNLADLFQIEHAADLYRSLYPIFRPPGPRRMPRIDPLKSQAVLDRWGVALLVSDRPEPGARWPVVASGGRDDIPFFVYRNRTAMPRSYVVPRARVVEADEVVDRLIEQDPRAAVLMTSDPLDGLPGRRQSFIPADDDASDPDRVRIRVTTEAPGLLVVAETWMPGWSATVNGQAAPVLRGDHAFRVVPLPEPGRLEIVMTFEAPGLRLGALISGASMVVLGIGGFVRFSKAGCAWSRSRRLRRALIDGR